MQLQGLKMERTERMEQFHLRVSYFFRRILAFGEATRKGSHAKKKKREKKLEERESWGVKYLQTCEQGSGNIAQSCRRTSCGHRDAKRGELPDYRQAVHVRAGLHKSTAQKLKDETMPTRIHVSTCNVRYIMPFQLLAVFFFFFFLSFFS